MNTDKTIVFEQFAKKAKARLEERKKQRVERIKLANMDGEILEIHGLTDNELNDCMEFSDMPIAVDQYTLYMAAPKLQAAAKFLVEQGVLQPGKEYKITDMFTSTERNFLVKRVLYLSGALGDPEMEIMEENEEIKNS